MNSRAEEPLRMALADVIREHELTKDASPLVVDDLVDRAFGAALDEVSRLAQQHEVEW